MNKFYLLTISLILLNPCFANDNKSGKISHQHPIYSETQQKKEVRKNRPISRDERLLSQKKRNFSDRMVSRKKNAQSPRQVKQAVPEGKKESAASKNQQAIKPDLKNAQDKAVKQTPKTPPALKTPQNLAETKKLLSAAQKTQPQEEQTSKQFSQPKSPQNLAEIKKDPPKPEVKERIEKEKQTPKFPKSLDSQNSVMSKRVPPDESMPSDGASDHSPNNTQLADQTPLPSFPIEDFLSEFIEEDPIEDFLSGFIEEDLIEDFLSEFIEEDPIENGPADSNASAKNKRAKRPAAQAAERNRKEKKVAETTERRNNSL